ncbi:MFS transporter [Desulfitobacterium sp. AusDCA]|uniref:MFS transporter n=1 Tax=Desulfitobacterium sp. AusDCA TaxID=3240383 RepID=UPI003DA6F2FE
MSAVNRNLILIKCALIMACAGLLYSVSVFIKPLAAIHGWNVQSTAMVGSAMLLFWPLGIFAGGKILSMFGPKITTIIGSVMFGGGLILSAFVPSSQPWLIYVTYSAISGFGNGIAYNGATFTAGSWFPEKTGFATGICIAVYGGASAFLAPLATKLILLIGVNLTLIGIGTAFCIIAIIAGLGLESPPDGYIPEGTKIGKSVELGADLESYTLKEAVKTKPFWLLQVATTFFPSVYLIMFPLFVIFCTEKGISLAIATLGVSIFSLASLAGRFILGSLQDKLGFKKVYTVCWFFTMLSVLLLIKGNSAPIILLAYACIGFGFGPANCVYPYTTIHTFGPKFAGTIYGGVLLGFMVWTQVVPRISTILVNSSSGSYTASFTIAGILCTIAMVSMWFVQSVNRNKRVEKFASN